MRDAGLEHLRIHRDGIELHAVAAGPKNGPLVILLHGFPEFWYGWRHQIDPLAEAGFRVVAPDQRGYNRSSKPAGIAAYDLNELAGDVAAVADRCGHDDFDVVGHDWGGIVAWWTAIRHPSRVRRLVVLNAPHPMVGRRFVLAHPRQFVRSWYVFFFQLPGVPELLMRRGDFAALKAAMTRSAPPGLFSTADFRAYQEAWSQPGALTAMINWYRALMRFRPGRTDGRVRQRTLIIWADRDRFLEPGLADASGAFCDKGRIVRVPDASHWLQHERPELVTEEIRTFLSGERN